MCYLKKRFLIYEEYFHYIKMQLCYKVIAYEIVDNAIYDYRPGDGLE